MSRSQLIPGLAVLALLLAAVCVVLWTPLLDHLSRESAESVATSAPSVPLASAEMGVAGATTPATDYWTAPFLPDEMEETSPLGGYAAAPARANQLTFLFRDGLSRDQFLNALRNNPRLSVIGRIDPIFAVSVAYASEADLIDFLQGRPTPLATAPNFLLTHPDPAPANASAVDPVSYAAFAESALAWLGVPDANGSWGAGVNVAVADSAVQAHPTFPRGAVTTFAVTGLEEAPGAPSPEAADVTADGHGTAVASLIAGQHELARGIAPGATVLAYDVFHGQAGTDAFTVASAVVQAADAGVRVLNLSVGGAGDNPVLRAAVDYALARGVVVVAAAGNEGVQQVAYPARYPGVVAVGAVDANGEAPAFSNTGPEIALAAPGYGVYAAWGTDAIASMSGTSASAPLAAGAVAALLSIEPNLTGAEAVELLRQYADDAGAPGPDPQYGSGVLNLRRVLQRNQRGIHDAAVSGLYPETGSSRSAGLPVLVTVQNQGTENFGAGRLSVRVNGREQLFFTPLLRPGETSTFRVTVPAMDLDHGKAAVIDAAVSLKQADAYPGNDTRHLQVRRPEEM